MRQAFILIVLLAAGCAEKDRHFIPPRGYYHGENTLVSNGILVRVRHRLESHQDRYCVGIDVDDLPKSLLDTNEKRCAIRKRLMQPRFHDIVTAVVGTDMVRVVVPCETWTPEREQDLVDCVTER